MHDLVDDALRCLKTSRPRQARQELLAYRRLDVLRVQGVFSATAVEPLRLLLDRARFIDERRFTLHIPALTHDESDGTEVRLGVWVVVQRHGNARGLSFIEARFEGLEQRVLLERMIEHGLRLGDRLSQQVGEDLLRIGIVGEIMVDGLAQPGADQVGLVPCLVFGPCLGFFVFAQFVDDVDALGSTCTSRPITCLSTKRRICSS